MTWLARKAWAHFVVHYGLMTAYRAEILLWGVATALPLIMMGVWTEAAATGSFSLSSAEMARYFIAVYIIRQFSIVWVIYDFEWHVVSGRLSPRLLYPIDPSFGWFVAHFSEQACRFPIVVALVGLCYLIFPQAFVGGDGEPGWSVSAANVALAVGAVYLSFCCRYALQYSLAMLAFWVERVTRLEELQMLPFVFFSGMLFPLSELQSFSPMLYEVALLTPYPWMLWFPATLLTGGEAPVLQGFVVLGGWLVVFYVMNRLLWRRGLRHYSSMGA